MVDVALDTGESTLEHIWHQYELAQLVLERLKSRNLAAEPPRAGPTFSISQAAALVGRSSSAIRVAESEGRLPAHGRNELGRRNGYTLADLDKMRSVFETRPWRDPTDPTAILAVQNFKGGVGKSTISVHLAQYLAIQGYRVLLIDADAQASATMMFGLIPDTDLGEDDSIYALTRIIDGKPSRKISELVRKTHFHNLDLIPANLILYNAEYEIAARMNTGGVRVLGLFASEIQRVAPDYDVIILDPPPALGMISLSVLNAANALLIPMPPNIIDFASTTAFLGMLGNTMDQMAGKGLVPNYGFIKMLFSKSSEAVVAQREIVDMATRVFGRTILETEVKTSAEIDNAFSKFQSVYDLTGPTSNYAVRQRCLRQLDSANHEVEVLIRGLWPSTRSQGA